MKKCFAVWCSMLFLTTISICQSTKIEPVTKDYIYLHTDRDYYIKGSTLFFKVYLTDETKILGSSESGLIYVELISDANNIIERKIIKIDNGIGVGNFDLASIEDGGAYLLRAYSNYMRNFGEDNFFKKTIFIGEKNNFDIAKSSVSDEVFIKLLPEGGDLISGIESNLIFKTTNSKGKGVSAGVAIFSGDESIVNVTTDNDGFSKVKFVPKVNHNYSIKVDGRLQTVDFPPILNEGVVLSVTTNIDNFKVAINATKLNSDATLILFSDDGILVRKEIKMDKIYDFKYDFIEYSPGVVHVSVYSQSGEGLAERLVFNHVGIENYNIDILQDKDKYGKRSLVEMVLDFYDDDGESLAGNYSISIVDSYLNKSIKGNDDIRSYYYLTTQLEESITQNFSYVYEDVESSFERVDKLMLTNGWRRFKLNGDVQIKYPHEKELLIKGKAHSIKDTSKAETCAGLMYVFDNLFNSYEFIADQKGDIVFSPEVYGDSVQVFFKLGKYGSKKGENDKVLKVNKKLSLTLDTKKNLVLSEKAIDQINEINFVEDDNVDTLSIARYQELLQQVNYSGYSLSEDIEEVTIKAERVEEVVQLYEKAMLYSRPNTRILAQDLPLINQYFDIYDILRGRVAGLQLDAPDIPGIKHTVILRGRVTDLTKSTSGVKMSNSARFMVNGSFVPTRMAESIAPAQIAFVDVVSSLDQLTLYGEQGYNGIVNIYLKQFNNIKKPWSDTDNSNLISKMIKGYHQSREFYHPNYNSADIEHQNFDQRITLYWQPNLVVDDSGSAYIEFFTADRNTIYDIVIEGISNDGLPIRTTSKLVVSE